MKIMLHDKTNNIYVEITTDSIIASDVLEDFLRGMRSLGYAEQSVNDAVDSAYEERILLPEQEKERDDEKKGNSKKTGGKS